MYKTALVTGGAGFIGSYLVEYLLEQGVHPRIYDNFTTGSLDNLRSRLSDIEVIEGDIRDYDSLVKAAKGSEVVFHLAALTSVSQSVNEPLLTHEVDVTGTLNVLWAAVKVNAARVVLSSSCAIYGDTCTPPIQESELPLPKSPYAASKQALEAFAHSFYYSYQLETVCLRYFNAYGRRQKANSDYAAAIPRFIECYKAKRRPQVYGDGLQTRDFIHASDIARANFEAALVTGPVLNQHRVLNIGTGVGTSILDLLEAIAEQAGYTLEPEFQPARPGEIRNSWADCSLSKALLNFEAQVDLKAGIQHMYWVEP